MGDSLLSTMRKSPLFRLLELPFCQALMFEPWNAAAGRFFVALRSRGAFSALLGNGVVEEFRTISGPVLLAPSTILGSIYDAGMQLADARDAALPIDQGWPPLTVGIDVAAPERPDDWLALLLDAIRQQKSVASAPWQHNLQTVQAGDYRLQVLECRVAAKSSVTVIATDAPLLPQQLQRLADLGTAPISIAVALGNRLPRVAAGELQQLDVVSEQGLLSLVASASRLKAVQE